MNFVNLDFECSYNDLDCSMSDTQYRKEFLDFFKCTEFNETVMSIRTDKLYFQLRDNEQFKELFNLVLSNTIIGTINTEICSMCLTYLFSYDNLYLFIPCLQDFKKDTVISDIHFNNLKNKLLQN